MHPPLNLSLQGLAGRKRFIPLCAKENDVARAIMSIFSILEVDFVIRNG
jgi:hypothetical protein